MDIEAEQSDKMEKEEVHLVNFSEIVGDMDGVNVNLPQENISDSDYFSYNINCFNSTPVCFTKIMELYASKTRHKSKEKTILDQDAIDLPQLSPYELMLRLLLRLILLESTKIGFQFYLAAVLLGIRVMINILGQKGKKDPLRIQDFTDFKI